MNIFYNLGHAIGHAIASTMVFLGLHSQTAVIVPPQPIVQTALPVQIQPLTQDDAQAIVDIKKPERPYVIQPIQNITINNPAPIVQQPIAVQPSPQLLQVIAKQPMPEQEQPKASPTIKIIETGTAPTSAPHQARDKVLDSLNIWTVGAIITDPDGNAVVNDKVKITTTDPTQDREVNKAIFGGADGYPNGAYAYTYEYEIKTIGQHEITFTYGGVSQTTTLNVSQEDTR